MALLSLWADRLGGRSAAVSNGRTEERALAADADAPAREEVEEREMPSSRSAASLSDHVDAPVIWTGGLVWTGGF
eukprot:3954279-Prymnesium_polylepis.1